MKRLYAKYSKVRNATSQYLAHLEGVQKKESEAAELKKKLLVNQENQNKDILQMCDAIKEDLTNYNKDAKSYSDDIKLLKGIKIHDCLVRDGKATLADYIPEDELLQSKTNLDNRKAVLNTKMDKLNHSSKTLKNVIEGVNQDSGEDESSKSHNLQMLQYIHQQIEAIGTETGLGILNEKPDLLGKEDYKWGSSGDDDRQLYDKLARAVRIANSKLEKLSLGCKDLYDEYISTCKKIFEKLTKINTAIGKNEGERIKTLKTYEMFKKEYKFFQTPKYLPKCYNESIFEMKRRIKFRKFIKYAVDKLRSLCEYENKKRDDFLKKNGLYIPKSMLPQLGDQAPMLKCFPKEMEAEEYPDNLLTDHDKKINGID